MKSIYIILLTLAVSLGSCSKFTDIKPKGQSLLDNVADLELLLNHYYAADAVEEVIRFVNDFYPMTIAADLVANNSPSLDRCLYLWDESIVRDRANFTETDERYTYFYSIIGRVANPILNNVGSASGDQKKGLQIKAEAYVLRAYFHYLSVIFFAKAYDPITAASDPGIPYLFEDDLLSVPNEKYTVKEVYDFILADLNAAIESNNLPDDPTNRMRVGKAFAYAIKAKVLMSMRDFDGAYEAAGQSLAIRNTVDDYREQIPAGVFVRTRDNGEDLFYANLFISGKAFSAEMADSFEEGHIVLDYYLSDRKAFGFQMFGPYLYGLSIDVWYSLDTYYSGLGLTTVDMLLTRAECLIRRGGSAIEEGMTILNSIREKRIATEQYLPGSATTTQEAFAVLRNVSRCENFATYKNFANLKRWNTEAAFSETITKTLTLTIGGVTGTHVFTLTPDSPLWIFPFPKDATLYNPNLTQNSD